MGWLQCSGDALRFIEVRVLVKLFAESGIHEANLMIFCVSCDVSRLMAITLNSC